MENARGPLRVLIADDHALTRAALARAIERDERFVVCAETGDAAGAVASAVRKRPDICVLDVKMPGSGLSAAWEIAARLPETRIVMLSASGEDRDIMAALRAGVDGYLLKTMDLRKLPDALAGMCAGEAAMQRTTVLRVLRHFRAREPRWRRRMATAADGPPAMARLTSREWEVLELPATGHSTAAIGRSLVITPSAVRVHIAAIVRKLGVPDRAAAIELFRERSEN
jgi:DNA-binding NarL/FixJ family response regulator